MEQKRNLVSLLQSKITIDQYHKYLMIFSCMIASVVFIAQLVSSSVPLSQMSGIQIFQSFWLPLMFVFMGSIFLVSGRAITDQIDTEKNLIIDEIEKIKSKEFSDRRTLRTNDELKEVMDKVHELADLLKTSN
ncbi:MAG: hypothetical protein CL677_08005 [Bdellovibrionaceae bacterium]|nr:hypothetical protein [Pseudobdellovibrionaceae bacterium]|tara:strand:- start:120748 stop:121146 length:399 start_codon:yes stop_codon:yes gene_type:complete